MTEVYVGSIASSRQRSQVNEDAVCTLNLPSKLLLEWKRKVNKGTATSYVSQLNENVKGKIVQIADGERANRLEGRLGRKAGEIETELRVKKRRRETILQKEVSFKVMKEEVVSADDIEDQYRYYTSYFLKINSATTGPRLQPTRSKYRNFRKEHSQLLIRGRPFMKSRRDKEEEN